MSHDTKEHEPASQPAGIVERLVLDDVDRKRFLKAVGGVLAIAGPLIKS
jgi:hypothetical protein